ncbi:hypothetical protein TH25_18215 [Thalassospira profundimaris]|uniref:Nucleotidyltransferase-like domain-containing protein n=1 Tax=Thalassospira profundimaris TaxID=502049 RepID=A0A367WX37_9PROT|nr:hypothetical protein TH25_18215 [Thalassospira profundimaris]
MAGNYRNLSATAVATYTDLLRLLKDEQVLDVRGTPELRVLNGREYWYDRYRLGTDTIVRFIGPNNDDMRQRIERINAIRAEQKERQKQCGRLMRILRAEGLLPVDRGTGSLLAAMARVGVFRLGGVLVGTNAFRLYEGELGIRLTTDDLAQTMDVDIASFERLSVAIDDQVDENLGDVFADLKFEAVPSQEGRTFWRWKQKQDGSLVEFLSPSFDEQERVKNLPALGVSALSLHHLNYLIADPIKSAVLYRNGLLVNVPRPERFAIHKLIVADRRHGSDVALKQRKDQQQAALLIEVLAQDRPYDLKEALEDARDRGPKWRNRIKNTLGKMPQTAEILAGL